MGRIEVQGIVSMRTGEPLVQFRQVDDDGTVTTQWQQPVLEAREHAQMVVEAAQNAVTDAALVAWAKETWPEGWQEVAAQMVVTIRRYRADAWGLPDEPEDWRP